MKLSTEYGILHFRHGFQQLCFVFWSSWDFRTYGYCQRKTKRQIYEEKIRQKKRDLYMHR